MRGGHGGEAKWRGDFRVGQANFQRTSILNPLWSPHKIIFGLTPGPNGEADSGEFVQKHGLGFWVI